MLALKSVPRALACALSALALTVLCRAAAQADPITLTIVEFGSAFSGGFVNPPSTNVGGLTFTGTQATFTAESGGPPVAVTLGTFTLTNAAHNYSGIVFRRGLQFVSPGSTDPAGGLHPTAVITGSVGPGGGSVVFDFHRPGDPTSAPRLYTFTSAGGVAGSFVLDLNDLTIQTDGTGTVTATLTGIIRDFQFEVLPVPEPATLLLLGTGLTGVAAAVRRRRKA